MTSDSNSSLSLWSSLQVVDEIVIIAVNQNCNGYNKNDCELGKNVHWNCDSYLVKQVNISLPSDFGSSVNVKEIVNGTETDIDFSMKIVNSTILQFNSVTLDEQDTTRIFLLTNQ